MSRQVLERSLPSSIDAERSLLGSILVNNENYYRIVEFLRPEDFYLDSHRVIFRNMTGLMENSRAIDLITLQDELLRNASLESAGGIGYLSGLLEGIPYLTNIEHYIDIVRDKSLLRQMINSASKVISECFDQAEPATQSWIRQSRRCSICPSTGRSQALSPSQTWRRTLRNS